MTENELYYSDRIKKTDFFVQTGEYVLFGFM